MIAFKTMAQKDTVNIENEYPNQKPVKMTKETYIQKFSKDDAPGWLAIDQKLAEIYKGQKGKHLGPLCGVHYQVGGNDPIDGTSIYKVELPEKHIHIVNYGMSNLYYNPKKAGEEFSAWGFEFTFRLKQNYEDQKPIWAINLINNLARYVFKSGRWFEPNQHIPINGPIRSNSETLLTAILFVEDPILGIIQTPHGEVTFLQMIGITDLESARITNSEDVVGEIKKMISEMKEDNPLLITDLNRTKQYL